MKVRVIPADLSRPPHREALVRLLSEYCSGSTGEGRPLRRRVIRSLADSLVRHPTSRVFFAVFNRRLVGLATCFNGFSTFRGKALINVHDLVVERRFRRRGAASALLRHIEGLARREDCCRLTLEVRNDNDAAQALYRRSGFGPGAHPMSILVKAVPPCTC